MSDAQIIDFTAGAAAEYASIPRETLRSWVFREQLAPIQSINARRESAEGRRWVRFSRLEVALLRLTALFSRIADPHKAAELAATCENAVTSYLFDGVPADRRARYRFVAIQLIQDGDKMLFAPGWAATVSELIDAGCAGVFVVDLETFPKFGTTKESEDTGDAE